MNKELTIILGPTGVGKTDYSIELAHKFGSPIINCDSRQIFKEMRIGTAPPSDQQLATVKHYFIFSHSIKELYTAGKYEIEAMELLTNLFTSHHKLVMVGGSGMYIDALCNGLDDFPETDITLREELTKELNENGLSELCNKLKLLDKESYDTIDLANPQRVQRALEVTIQTGRKFSDWKSAPKKERPFKINKIGINRDRAELYDRINKRVGLMLEDGLIEEAESLIQYRDTPALQTVGYKELFEYFDGKISLDQAIELIKRNSRRYAKRQLTYWGRDKSIEWLDFSSL